MKDTITERATEQSERESSRTSRVPAEDASYEEVRAAVAKLGRAAESFQEPSQRQNGHDKKEKSQ